MAVLPAHATEALYKATCSTCHDSGAGNAPRLTERDAWIERAARGRSALYARTIKGIPNTPMAPKGGFAELSDAQLRTLVDYMLAASGHADTPMEARRVPASTSASAAPAARAAAAATPVSDASITAAVAARLRAELGKPGMLLDLYEGVITIRGLGIKVETQNGHTILSGVVHDAGLIASAERIASGMPAVKQVTNRVIAGAMLDFD